MGLKHAITRNRAATGSAETPKSERPGTVNEPGYAEPARTGTAEPETENAFDDLEVDDGPRVGIVMGSKSDEETMAKASAELEERGIRYEVRVMSAHRDPDMVTEYAKNARMRGLKVIIAGAGMSAALPGVVAAHSDLPVIGVPCSGKSLGGLDALLSAVQMPPGVPVACVAIDGARNAAILAARILSV